MNGAKIQNSDSITLSYCPIISYAIIKFNLATEIAKKIGFENGNFRELKCSVTLALDHLESHANRFVSSTSIHITKVHMAPSSIVNDGRKDIPEILKFVGTWHVKRVKIKKMTRQNYILSYIVYNNQIQPSYRNGEGNRL